MVSRREKLSRSYFRLREQTFQKQVAILGEKSADSLNAEERSAILAANHGPSIYDQLYSMESTNVACKDYDTLVSLIAGEDKKDKLINGVIKPKKSIASNALANIINSTNSFKKQFVNGARKKNLLGECSSVSESDASISDATAAARKKVLGGSGRKPLSYLFDSDSSMDGGSLGGEKSINKKLVKGSSPKRGVKSTKKSSSSESEDLDISLAKGNGTGKTEAPIYSDSDSDAVSARRAGSPMATKAAFKEFSKKSNKTGAQPSRKGTVARKKKGLPPTDLIVPQREAAKKATESIKSVKPKKEGDSSSVKDFQISSPSSRANDRESDSFEKTAFEKFKDIAAASVQDKQKKGRVKATESRRGGTTRKRPNEESPLDLLDPELRDQFEFDGSNDSKNVPNFVPQRQAAKKAAEHIRSGLSNIVAARLIIEDEMEATTKKKLKGEKLKNAQVSAVILGKKGNKIKGSVREETDESPSTGDRQRSRKRTLSKGKIDSLGIRRIISKFVLYLSNNYYYWWRHNRYLQNMRNAVIFVVLQRTRARGKGAGVARLRKFPVPIVPLTGPFLTGGRSQRVVEAGNEAAHPARQVQAAHPARIHLPLAAPPHRPHLRLRPPNPFRPPERHHHYYRTHHLQNLLGFQPRIGVQVGSLKLPIGAPTVDPAMRLLRERNLPPKVVDPLNFDRGEVQLAVTRTLRRNPTTILSQPMMSSTQSSRRSQEAVAVPRPAAIAVSLPPVPPESPIRIINLRKRKGNEERENHQEVKKKIKLSLPRPAPVHQSRLHSLKRELRPRR